jgi:hypothetical protein
MGSVRSQVVAVALATAMGVGLIVGCSASGDSDAVDETNPTDPSTPPPATLPPPGNPPGAVDASTPPPAKKDAGKDSSVDAGPPPPVPGTACSTLDEVKKKPCGACGQQSTICLAPSGDAGGGTWTEYGPCGGELVGGCVPGTVVSESCGNCGTRTKTCSQYCGFSTGACTGEPASSCVPGAVDLSNAGCGADTYHQRTCQSTCTYANFGAACDAAPTTITVGPTVGNVTSTIVTLTSTQTATRLGGTCPTATLTAATTTTPHAYIKVHNPLAKSVVVSVYDSIAPGGVVFPTVLASYGAATPTTDVQRKACAKGVNDFGNDLLTGDSDFASLDDAEGNAVTIPANGTVTIYNAAYNKYSAATPSLSTGKVKLNVRLETIN